MVDAGQLSPVYLRGYAYTGGQSLSPAELGQVLGRLITAAHKDDVDAAKAALDILWIQFRASQREGSGFIDSSSPTWPLLVEVLELTLKEPGREAHAWDDLLGELYKADPAQAIRLAAASLSSSDPSHAQSAAIRLAQSADPYPLEVMRSFGDALLDPESGVYLGLHSLRNIIAALPVYVVREWMEGHGVEAAAAIARHLPEPAVVDGQPVVPELTHYVMARFEQDDRVYREFLAGTYSRSHSGDIAAQVEQEGEEVRPFLGHPLRRIRQWAEDCLERLEARGCVLAGPRRGGRDAQIGWTGLSPRHPELCARPPPTHRQSGIPASSYATRPCFVPLTMVSESEK